MPEPSRGPPKPVTVIHFAKPGKPRDPVTVTVTKTEAMRALDEVTDPLAPAVHEPSPAPQRRPTPRPTPRTVKASSDRKSGKRVKSTPAPGGASPLPKAVLSHVAEQSRPKTPQEVADLALFGHQLFEMGRLEEARVIFEGLVSTDSRDAFSHTMLGTIYLALGKQDRALELFVHALKLDPADLAALVYRGEVRLNQGKVRAALEDLERAVALGRPHDPFVERAKRLVRMAKGLLQKKRR